MKKLTFASVVFVFMLMFPLTAQAREVTVTLPDFPITINGQMVDSQYDQYPFLVYQDIAYLPLASPYNQFTGLTISMQSQWGSNYPVFFVGRAEITSVQWLPYVQASANHHAYKATLPDQGMAVNAFRYHRNQELAYPLFTFREIYYLPLTWENVVEKLGWSYVYDEQKGLIIDSTDPLRPIIDGNKVSQQLPTLADAMEYVYFPDGFVGYRPMTVGSYDMAMVYKKAGEPLKTFDLDEQLVEICKRVNGALTDVFMNRQVRGPDYSRYNGEADMQPYREGDTFYILCAMGKQTLKLQIDLAHGQIVAADPYPSQAE